MKSEPTTFSISALNQSPNQTTYWDGVRNYQARNMIRDQMQRGDLAYFYHSNCELPGIVGIMEIVTPGYPDFTAFDPKHEHYDPKNCSAAKPQWYMVDVKFKQQFSDIITLNQMRATPSLRELLILRKGNRLSVTPVTAFEWKTILKLAGK